VQHIKALSAREALTMRQAEGIGLAAQQVAKALQLCVVEVPESDDRPSNLWIDAQLRPLAEHMPIVLINPELKPGREKVSGNEGCLSFPDLYGEVPRYTHIEVKALDATGKSCQFQAEGFFSRALQHEIDHLDGKLFIDHLKPLKRQLMLVLWRLAAKPWVTICYWSSRTMASSSASAA
jgi:peptide deformylase